MISLVEKLKVNKDFKEFDIDSLKDVNKLSTSVANVMNQYYEEHDMIYKFIYKVYDVDGTPHLFIKTKNKTNLNDSPWDSNYGIEDWVYGLYKLKDKLGDYFLDNLFGFSAKWNFIDKTSRINNLGKTAYGFYTTFNGMLFNSSKDARKFIRENKLKTPNDKAVHPKSLRELFDIYEMLMEDYYHRQYKLIDKQIENPIHSTLLN